jgi:hypothetical protein
VGELLSFGEDVKTSTTQYLFANNWPIKMHLGIAAVLGLWIAVSICQPSMSSFADWQYSLLFVVSILLAPIVAVGLSLILVPFVWGPIFHARERLNGGPFLVGDRVRILVGPHRGRISRVYSLWQGSSVRVQIGKEAEDTYKDVFSPMQLVREGDAEQTGCTEPGDSASVPYRSPLAPGR